MKKAILVALMMMAFAVLTAEVVDVNGHHYMEMKIENDLAYAYVGDTLRDAFLDIERGFDCKIDWDSCEYVSEEDMQETGFGIVGDGLVYWGTTLTTKQDIFVMLVVMKGGVLSLVVVVAENK